MNKTITKPKLITVPIESTFNTDQFAVHIRYCEIKKQYPNRTWEIALALRTDGETSERGWVVVEKVLD